LALGETGGRLCGSGLGDLALRAPAVRVGRVSVVRCAICRLDSVLHAGHSEVSST